MSHQETTAPPAEALPFYRSRPERERILAEKLARWRALAADLKKQSDALAVDFDREYQEAINTVLNLFSRMDALDSRARWLQHNRPSGPLVTTELKRLMERERREFALDPPPLLRLSRLYDPNGKQLWPPPEWGSPS
jgi:hypothetical protein